MPNIAHKNTFIHSSKPAALASS